MSVREDHWKEGGVFFCSFTCYKWLPLFERADMYDWIHDWFRRLHAEHNRLIGYVIMPNHLHMLLLVPEGTSVNKLLAEGKRFMAYAIRKRLEAGGHEDLLAVMAEGVRNGDAARGQKYRAFETSSDIKECWSETFLHQKLEYMHANPVSGKWSLAEDPALYPYSSAAFYERNAEPMVPLLHVSEL
ncbi:MAG: hypothetical protein IPG10_17415 [Flavobacteriales bacterium]|jgi:REP element-mobilizing transposase RayT|nr:hypothetical protein [Flavobacteriales bacterium]MBK7269399.1 hypothetical protein [Flavobacteriales bacterium]MBK7753803.1 hypothetical protein [Flavobacteriales bacterium]MBK9075083.1 hypothetical protein [Flavobacteriales bacterium]MBK9540356.1 hypothetical protein [Flavobacteriales bacterium]